MLGPGQHHKGKAAQSLASNVGRWQPRLAHLFCCWAHLEVCELQGAIDQTHTNGGEPQRLHPTKAVTCHNPEPDGFRIPDLKARSSAAMK